MNDAEPTRRAGAPKLPFPRGAWERDVAP